ncbi:cobalamin B12-binding domain-containing protein [Chloroflexota bacterium]
MLLNMGSFKQGVGQWNKDKPKILLARFSLDGHDRGVITVMDALKNAGMEVVYVLFSDPKEIVKSAIEEDVDLIGVTSSQGEHLLVCSTLMEELGNIKVNIPVIIGGVIPSADVPKLMDMGIKGVFGPGSRPGDAASFISQIIQPSE